MGSNSKKRVNEDSEEYKVKRARNNEVKSKKHCLEFTPIFTPFLPFQAVKKSREKSKQHAKETQGRVDKLKAENDKLRENIRTVHKNLQTLKDLFINAATAKKQDIDMNKVRTLLQEIDTMDTIESDNSSGSEGEEGSDSD